MRETDGLRRKEGQKKTGGHNCLHDHSSQGRETMTSVCSQYNKGIL